MIYQINILVLQEELKGILHLLKKKYNDIRQKLKIIDQRNRRLIKKVKTYEDLIKTLQTMLQTSLKMPLNLKNKKSDSFHGIKETK